MQAAISQRVEQIRHWLTENQLDALLIPHEDEFLGEYIPDHNERLHWLTGFTGSAGAAIITRDDAAVFVDGRYVVQVRKQVPADVFQYCHLIEQPPVQWALENLAVGSKVAIDARLHSAAWLKNATTAIDSELALVCVDENPIDQLWLDRPAPVLSDAQLMGLEFVGQSSADKRQQIAALLTTQKANAAFLSQLDSIAWLLNIRGDDVHCLPVLLSAAVIHDDASVDFYIDHHRLPEGFTAHVGDGVTLCEPEQLATGLASLAGKRVLFDSTNSNAWAAQQLKDAGALLIEAANPTLLPKSTKNVTEMAGMKACHIRDGVAISKFLAWVDTQVAAGHLLDEAQLSDQLWQFRQLDPSCSDVSFDTISAAAGNAAM